jgi:hypothetical protein
MATNLPAANFDMVGYVLGTGAETGVEIPERVLRFIALQCTTYADVYLGRTPGQTFVVDNRWTIKAGQILVLEDIALMPMDLAGTFFYARGSANGLVLEVLYAAAA